MEDLQFSLYSIAEFLEAKDSRRLAIIKERSNFNFDGPFHYQSIKSTITKFILSGGKRSVLNTGIQYLKNKTPDTDWKKRDQEYSLEAAELFKNIPLPEFLKNGKLELIRTQAKFLPIHKINIIISPNAIFRLEYEGKKYLGAVKVHVAKGKAFNNRQSALVAQLLNQFLSNFVASEDEIVHPRLCICIDPFAQTIINASHKMKLDMKQLKMVCDEIHQIRNSSDNKDVIVA